MLRLICELLCNTFKIYVHVDKLSKEITEEHISELNSMKNVYAIKKYECYWNSYNHLVALIELAKMALEDKDINYIHFSSGEDLPIKSPEGIAMFYDNSGNKGFLNFQFPDAMTDKAVRECWEYYHFLYNGCDVRKAPFCDYVEDMINWQKKHGISKTGLGEFKKIYKGVIWSSLTREALEFCFRYADRHPDYIEDIKYTRIRDEFYFHIILFNHADFEQKVIKDGKHGMYWKNGFYYMTIERYKNCEKAGKLFIRKVSSKQEELINYVLEKISSEYRLIDNQIYIVNALNNCVICS